MKQLAFITSEATHLYNPDEIIKLVAQSNYTEINTTRGKITAARVLRDYSPVLVNGYGFLRINRSCIVNPLHIKKILSTEIVLSDGTRVVVPRESRKEFKEKLEIHIQYT